MAKPIERRPGFWELRARVRTVNGKPEYLYGTFEGGPRNAQKAQNKLEAEAALERDRRNTRDRGEEVAEPVALTVADALEGYWADHGCNVESPGTIRRHIDKFLTPGLGNVELGLLRGQLSPRAAKLNPHLVDISAFYRDLGIAPAYAHRIHATFRAALQYAVREGWVGQNPAADAKKPKVKKRPSTTPEAADLAALMARLRADHQRLYVFALLVGSGLRPVEAYPLRWSHLDLDNATLSTDASGLVKIKGGSELREGETKKRRVRTISLDPVTLAALRVHRKWCMEYAMMAGVRLWPSSFLFSVDPAGTVPQGADWASRAWARQRAAAIAAGLMIPAGIRLYDVRHFLATQTLSKGHSPSEVAERMGNSHETVTRFYGHGTRVGDKALAATMGEVWG